MSYAHRLMAIEQPHRTEVTAFLINDGIVQFVRCSRTPDGGFFCETSRTAPVRRPVPTDPIPEGLYQLYEFFMSKKISLLGYIHVDHPFPSLALSHLLGSGSSGRVFAICGDDTRILKVVPEENETECEAEAATLRMLATWGISHTPRLVEAGECALVMSPRAVPMQPERFCGRHALQILETLKAAHQHQLYHRDVRPANLMLVGEDVLVNDWGYAVQGAEPVEYAGTFFQASDRVLEYLEKGMTTFAATAGDDLESLVGTIFALNYPRATVTS
jgi:serine/threonine protein kinase